MAFGALCCTGPAGDVWLPLNVLQGEGMELTLLLLQLQHWSLQISARPWALAVQAQCAVMRQEASPEQDLQL